MLSIVQTFPQYNATQINSKKNISKKVTFADEKGFNLINFNTMDNMENIQVKQIYKIEFSQINRNLICESKRYITNSLLFNQNWSIKFSDPALDLYNVEKRLLDQNVALESIRLFAATNIENRWKLSGTIKVKNLEFEKSVIVRATFNNWNTFHDFNAIYCFTSNFNYILKASENSDIFWFQIPLPQILKSEVSKVEFSILFKCKNYEYWDNNNGKNYCLVGTLYL